MNHLIFLLLFGFTNHAFAMNNEDTVISFKEYNLLSNQDDCDSCYCFSFGVKIFKQCFKWMNGEKPFFKFESNPLLSDKTCGEHKKNSSENNQIKNLHSVHTPVDVFDPFIAPLMSSSVEQKKEILATYPNIHVINDNRREFGKLTLEQIKWVFTNPNFSTDTENSMLSAFMHWLKSQREDLFPLPPSEDPNAPKDNFENLLMSQKRKFVDDYIRPVLRYIDFSEMTSFYRDYIVRNFMKEYDLVHEDIYNSMTTKIRNLQSLVYDNADEQFIMKVEFRKIDEWEPQKKYYSQYIQSNGYDFYIFMKQGPKGLEAYVRCIGPSHDPNHLLPVNLTLKIISSKKDPITKTEKIIRSFASQDQAFNHFDRSIGKAITDATASETWESFIAGKTPLTEEYEEKGVKHQRLTALLEVEFLDELPEAPFKGKNEFLNFDFSNEQEQKAMANLPISMVKGALEERRFHVDSEDSLFTILNYWIKQQETKNLVHGFERANEEEQKQFIETFIDPLLPLINFKKMMPFYFDHIVNNFMHEYHLEKTYADWKLTYDRIRPKLAQQLNKKPKNFMFKAIFNNVGSWEIDKKYFSSPILYLGYIFTYYVSPMENKESATTQLAGFLICKGETKSKDHHLPLKVSVRIDQHPDKARKFHALSINFDHFERAAGFKLTIEGEDWQRVQRGETVLTELDGNQTKMPVIIGVEFLSKSSDLRKTTDFGVIAVENNQK